MKPCASASAYRFRAGGLECDVNGLRLGGAPFLMRAETVNGDWTPAAVAEIERVSARVCGANLDASAEIAGLAVVASALNNDDLARVQIATRLLKRPDPADVSEDKDEVRKAAGWALKDRNADDHPRTGRAPNPGWFAPKEEADGETRQPTGGEAPNGASPDAVPSFNNSNRQESFAGDRATVFASAANWRRLREALE